MFPWRRKPYTIKVRGHCVFVTWHRPLKQWGKDVCERYSEDLRRAIRRTVADDVFEMLTAGPQDESPEVLRYVRRVMADLMAEFNLDAAQNEVTIAGYHMEMLIISFKAPPGTNYPYYYKGVQLKPYVE